MASNELFERWWIEAHVKGEEALGPLPGLNTVTESGTVLGDALQRARTMYEAGKEQGVVELGQVLNLFSSLQWVQRRSPSSYAWYKARLLGAPNDTGTFMGVRAEMSLEVMLLDCGVTFTKSERPDFWIDGYSKPVAVECTSARIYSSSVSEDVKIAATIRNKDKKYRGEPWHSAGPSILFVDVTSLKKSLHGIRMKSAPSPDAIDEGTRAMIRGTDFDFVFVVHEVHVLGLDKAAIQGRFINNDTVSDAAEAFIVDIENKWDKRQDLDVFLSPDI